MGSVVMRGNLLLILILIFGLIQAAKTTVGPADEDRRQIQPAINNAGTGARIEVHSGTSLERLRITKTSTHNDLDTGQGMPLIDGNGSSLDLYPSTLQGN